MELRQIASFSINHDRLEKGLYISRRDGDITTYDLRMKKPNMGDYLTTGAAHTLEHLFAVYARSSDVADKVIYIGPMGCRTGMYMLLRGETREEAVSLALRGMRFIASFDGPIPGARQEECGNYLDHDLPAAREAARDMAEILETWTAEKLRYPDSVLQPAASV